MKSARSSTAISGSTASDISNSSGRSSHERATRRSHLEPDRAWGLALEPRLPRPASRGSAGWPVAADPPRGWRRPDFTLADVGGTPQAAVGLAARYGDGRTHNAIGPRRAARRGELGRVARRGELGRVARFGAEHRAWHAARAGGGPWIHRR